MRDIFIAVGVVLTGAIVMRLTGLFGGMRGVNCLEPQDASRMIADGALVLDVRTLEEYQAARIPSAEHIPLSQIKERLSELDEYRDAPIIVSCRSGSRSARACAVLAKNGFEQVYNLKGGLSSWARSSLELEN